VITKDKQTVYDNYTSLTQYSFNSAVQCTCERSPWRHRGPRCLPCLS